jgi:hypothetical protein
LHNARYWNIFDRIVVNRSVVSSVGLSLLLYFIFSFFCPPLRYLNLPKSFSVDIDVEYDRSSFLPVVLENFSSFRRIVYDKIFAILFCF